MMGLITRIACPAQTARLDADQSNHVTSSVKTSRITLLSTRTSATLLSRQGHDLVSGHFYGPFSPHMRNELISAALAAFLLTDTHSASDDVKTNFSIRKQSQPFSYLLWNCDLPLRCYTHIDLLLLPIIFLPRTPIKLARPAAEIPR